MGKPINASAAGLIWPRDAFATFNPAIDGFAAEIGDTNAQDRLFITPKTAGGTPAAGVFVGAPSAGVGFSVVGTAGDTSVYEYEIR